jgi:hypothetical protein
MDPRPVYEVTFLDQLAPEFTSIIGSTGIYFQCTSFLLIGLSQTYQTTASTTIPPSTKLMDKRTHGPSCEGVKPNTALIPC